MERGKGFVLQEADNHGRIEVIGDCIDQVVLGCLGIRTSVGGGGGVSAAERSRCCRNECKEKE